MALVNSIGPYLEVDKDSIEKYQIFERSCSKQSCSNHKKVLTGNFCSECGTKLENIAICTSTEIPNLPELLSKLGFVKTENNTDILYQVRHLPNIFLVWKTVPWTFQDWDLTMESTSFDFKSIDADMQISFTEDDPEIKEFLRQFRELFGKDSISVKFGLVKHLS